MLDLLASLFDPDAIKNFLSGAAQTEFAHTMTIFAVAAFVHARQVRKEIRTQFGELVDVLREDLSAQKAMLVGVVVRVDKLEQQQNLTKEK